MGTVQPKEAAQPVRKDIVFSRNAPWEELEGPSQRPQQALHEDQKKQAFSHADQW